MGQTLREAPKGNNRFVRVGIRRGGWCSWLLGSDPTENTRAPFFFYHKPARRDSYAGSRVYYDELLGQVSAVQSRLLASRKVVLDVVLSYYNALCFRLHRRE